jgi:hypothetical protein
MGTSLVLGRGCGSDGFRLDLPLDHELDEPVVVDLSQLKDSHAMFAVRLRVFIDWHRKAGRDVRVIAPQDADTAQRLADLGLAAGLVPQILALPDPRVSRTSDVLPIMAFWDFVAIEEAAQDVVDLLRRQTQPFGSWGNAIHMAIGELCDNALQHGRNDLGAYMAADRILHPRRELRLAIADLGIGIPEHVRAQHPEWHDDHAAIARSLQRGVSGTGDPHRGNGFAEVFQAALRTDLARASSGADIDIRAGKGRVGVKIFGGTEIAEPRGLDRPRRGTWITYTVTTA